MTPGGIQEFIPIFLHKSMIIGAQTLPTVPRALASPNPKLLTFVGYNSVI